jgi:hypothetical protein
MPGVRAVLERLMDSTHGLLQGERVVVRLTSARTEPGQVAALGIYRSDLVAVINELAGRGLIERAPDPPTGTATSSP